MRIDDKTMPMNKCDGYVCYDAGYVKKRSTAVRNMLSGNIKKGNKKERDKKRVPDTFTQR